MIRCDECKEWYHGEYVRVTQEEAEAMGDFVCSGCQTSPGEGIVQWRKYWGSRGHNDSVWGEMGKVRYAHRTYNSDLPGAGWL